MTSNIPIHQSVLNKIKEDAVAPTPAWQFVLRDCGLVALWLFSLCIGALAVAVTLYAVTYQRYAFFEATHDSWLSLLLDTLPILWLGLLTVGLLLAARHQRHMRRGYRYPLWVLLGSSALISIVLGVLLHMANIGHMVDYTLGERMPLYFSQAKIERALWQQPDSGRLLGKQVFATVVPTSTIIFEDTAGVRWQTDISELLPADMQLLNDGTQVRLLGVLKNDVVHSFHACGAFPWMADQVMPPEQLQTERAAFLERVYRHDASPQERRRVLEAIVAKRVVEIPHSRCRDLPAIARMHRTMNH